MSENGSSSAKDVIPISSVSTGKPKPVQIEETLKKLRIIVEVNPYSVKEGTKEAGALWRKTLEMCKDNGVKMNYDASKKPVHSLQELVGRKIKEFRIVYPSRPPTGDPEPVMDEKDVLVYQLIKFKEEPKEASAARTVLKDRTEGMQVREDIKNKYREALMKPSGEKVLVDLPADSPLNAMERFDPALDVTGEAEVDEDGNVATEVPKAAEPADDGQQGKTAIEVPKVVEPAGSGLQGKTASQVPRVMDQTGGGQQASTSVGNGKTIGDIHFPPNKAKKRVGPPTPSGPVQKRNKAEEQGSAINEVVTTMKDGFELERLRLKEDQEARVAQQEQADKDRAFQREEAEKNRAHQMEMAKVSQETDLLKLKLILESKK